MESFREEETAGYTSRCHTTHKTVFLHYGFAPVPVNVPAEHFLKDVVSKPQKSSLSNKSEARPKEKAAERDDNKEGLNGLQAYLRGCMSVLNRGNMHMLGYPCGSNHHPSSKTRRRVQ